MCSALHSKHEITLFMAELAVLGFSAFVLFWANVRINKDQNHNV